RPQRSGTSRTSAPTTSVDRPSQPPDGALRTAADAVPTLPSQQSPQARISPGQRGNLAAPAARGCTITLEERSQTWPEPYRRASIVGAAQGRRVAALSAGRSRGLRRAGSDAKLYSVARTSQRVFAKAAGS